MILRRKLLVNRANEASTEAADVRTRWGDGYWRVGDRRGRLGSMSERYLVLVLRFKTTHHPQLVVLPWLASQELHPTLGRNHPVIFARKSSRLHSSVSHNGSPL